MVLTRVWAAHWAARPDQPVLIDVTGGRAWSGGELAAATASTARKLKARGVQTQDRVVVAGPPSDAVIVAFVALLRLGATVVPVNPNAAPGEIANVISATDPVLVVARSRSGDWGEVPFLPLDEIRDLWHSAAEPGFDEVDMADYADLAMICFTSGTTGVAKAVPITYGSLLAGTRALNDAWEWTANDVLLSALPLFHVHGLVVGVCASFTAGGAIAIQARFDPTEYSAAAIATGATMLFGVPTMWWRLTEAGLLAALDFVRLCVSGSAPLNPPLFNAIAEQIGEPPVERYGMTETLILTSNPLTGSRKPGSVGLPLAGVELRIAADGVVEVRGPSIFAGYLGFPSSYGFTADGWFRTGDLGSIDDDGYLFLSGRQSELIISGGHNIYPREIEDVLVAHPAVAEAAVIGRPDAQWGEVVTAFVVPVDGAPDFDVLAEAVAAKVSSYKVPREWHSKLALPRNSMGKVERSRLLSAGDD